MLAVDVILRLLHVVAMAALFGGMLFLAVVLVPVLRRSGARSAGSELLRQAAPRLRTLGWTALSLLVASGVLLLLRRGYPGPDALFARPFGKVLIAKLVLVALVLALSAVHDFSLGPRVAQLGRSDPDDPHYLRLRRRLSWFARFNAALVFAVVVLGVWLTRLY